MSGVKTGNFKDLTINSNIVVGNSIEFGFNTGVTIKRDNNNNIVFNDGTFNNKTLLQALNQVNENITQYDDATQKITIGKMASIQFDVDGNTSVMSIGNDLSINIGKSNYVNTIKLYNIGKYEFNVSGVDNGIIFREDNTISSHITTGYFNSQNKQSSESYLKLGTINTDGTLRDDMIIKAGKIGIGVDNPSYKLSIDGNMSLIGQKSIYWEGTPLAIKNIGNEMFLFDNKHPSGVSLEALQKAFMDISVLNDDLFQHFSITPNKEFLITGETPIGNNSQSLLKFSATQSEFTSKIISRGSVRITPDDTNYSLLETSGNDLFLTSSALPEGFYLKDIGDLPKGRFTDRDNQLYVIGDSSGISYFMNNVISDTNKKYEIDGAGIHTFYNAITFNNSPIKIIDDNNTLEITGNDSGIKLGVPNDSDAVFIDSNGDTQINSLSMRTKLTFLGGNAKMSNTGQRLIIEQDDLGMVIGKTNTLDIDQHGFVDISGAKHITFRNTDSGIFHNVPLREIHYKSDIGGIFFDGITNDSIIKIDLIDRLSLKRTNKIEFLSGNTSLYETGGKLEFYSNNMDISGVSKMDFYNNDTRIISETAGMSINGISGEIISFDNSGSANIQRTKQIRFSDTSLNIVDYGGKVSFNAGNTDDLITFSNNGELGISGLKELKLANSETHIYNNANRLIIKGDTDGIHMGVDTWNSLLIDKVGDNYHSELKGINRLQFLSDASIENNVNGYKITDPSGNIYSNLDTINHKHNLGHLNLAQFGIDNSGGKLYVDGGNLNIDSDISGTLLQTKSRDIGLYIDNTNSRIEINSKLKNKLLDASQNMISMNHIDKLAFGDTTGFISIDSSNNQLVLNGDISGVRIDVAGMSGALTIDSSGVVNMPTFQLDKFSEVALVDSDTIFFADYPRKVGSIVGDVNGFSINQGTVTDLLRTDSLGQISLNHTKGIYYDSTAKMTNDNNYLTLTGDSSGIAFLQTTPDSSGVYINSQGRLIIDGDFEFNKNIYRNGQEWPGLSNFWILNADDDLYYKNVSNVGISEPHPKWTMDISGDLHFNGQLYHNEEHSKIHWECGNIGIARANPYKPLDICGNMGITGAIVGDRDCRRTTLLDLSDNEVILKTDKTGLIFDNDDYTLKVGNYDMISINRGDTNRITFNRLRHNVDFIVDTSGTENSLVVRGNTGQVGLNTYNPRVQLDISGTDAIAIPKGTAGQRPISTDMTGMIRYNSDIGSYEGYTNGQWKDIVGNIDVDRDTYISVETNAGDDNDQIHMYTQGVKRLAIDQSGNYQIDATDKTILNTGLFGINKAVPTYNLDVSGSAQFVGDTFAINTNGGNTNIETGKLDVCGNVLVHSGHFDISNNSTFGFKPVQVTLEDEFDSILVDGIPNGDIIVYRGVIAKITISSPTEPIWIKTAKTTGQDDRYDTGIDQNGIEIGTITFNVPLTQTTDLYYVNENDATKGGNIIIRDSLTRVYGNMVIGDHTPTQHVDIEKNLKVGGNLYAGTKLLVGTELEVINKCHIKDNFTNKMGFLGFEFDGVETDGEYVNLSEVAQTGPIMNYIQEFK